MKRRRSELEEKEEYIRSWRQSILASNIAGRSAASVFPILRSSTPGSLDNRCMLDAQHDETHPAHILPHIEVESPTCGSLSQLKSDSRSLEDCLSTTAPSKSDEVEGGDGTDLLGPNGHMIFDQGLMNFDEAAGVIARTGQNVDLTLAEGEPQIYVGLSSKSVRTISTSSSG